MIHDAASIDTHPELAVERGGHGLGVGRWVPEEKHFYLKRYIDATREARKKFKRRVFIDPFCGPGRIQVVGESGTRDGGSVAAYRQSIASSAAFTSMLVGDIDGERVQANAQRLAALGASVQAFTGPAMQTVDAMVNAVPYSLSSITVVRFGSWMVPETYPGHV